MGINKSMPSSTSHQNGKVTANYSKKTSRQSWHLPPNRYDINEKPYDCKRGIGGAYWPKIHVHQAKPRPNFRQPHACFYNLPSITEKLFAPCHRTKGVFLSS